MRIFSKSPYGKEPRTLLTTKRVVLRGIAVSLSMFLLANTPVKAGPVVIRDVLQRIGSYQNPPDLLLRPVPQTPSRSDSKTPTVDATVDTAKDSLVIVTNSESLLTGVALETIEQDPVNVVIHGEVDGTVCDCGEITVAGGWPKWPLIFLAAIPLFFIDDDDCDDCDKVIPNPTPTPTPTPTPPPTTPVPEPASLLLFGSGLAALGASYRRRRLKAKLQQSDDSGGQA